MVDLLSAPIGHLIRAARERMGMSRAHVASSARVSERLLAELERGQRPNVSLETSLRLLAAVGVSMRLTDPSGAVVEISAPSAERLAREARAAHRRETWTGGRQPLHAPENDPPDQPTVVERLSSVARVSQSVSAIAAAVHESQPANAYAARHPGTAQDVSCEPRRRRMS